jgi:hypothetical protein
MLNYLAFKNYLDFQPRLISYKSPKSSERSRYSLCLWLQTPVVSRVYHTLSEVLVYSEGKKRNETTETQLHGEDNPAPSPRHLRHLVTSLSAVKVREFDRIP